MISAGTPLDDIAEAFMDRGAAAVLDHAPDLVRLDRDQLAALPSLPYSDAGFSRRLLREQLNPATSDSSRPLALIRRQLDWLTGAAAWQPRSVLHPLCGPGSYAVALRERGVERYTGIDAGPAVVAHAGQRLHGTEGFTFLRGDVTDPGLLGPAQPAGTHAPGRGFDSLLLSYDALNFFTPRAAVRMLAPLVDRLHDGGTAVFDVLLAEDGAPGFDDGRRAQLCPRGGLFHARPHLLLSEGFALPDGSAVGHRMIAVDTHGPRVAGVHHSILMIPTREELTHTLRTAGLRAGLVGRPFHDQNDPNLLRHLVVAHTGRRPGNRRRTQ